MGGLYYCEERAVTSGAPSKKTQNMVWAFRVDFDKIAFEDEAALQEPPSFVIPELLFSLGGVAFGVGDAVPYDAFLADLPELPPRKPKRNKEDEDVAADAPDLPQPAWMRRLSAKTPAKIVETEREVMAKTEEELSAEALTELQATLRDARAAAAADSSVSGPIDFIVEPRGSQSTQMKKGRGRRRV